MTLWSVFGDKLAKYCAGRLLFQYGRGSMFPPRGSTPPRYFAYHYAPFDLGSKQTLSRVRC